MADVYALIGKLREEADWCDGRNMAVTQRLLRRAADALEASHHEELVEALEDIAAHWNGSETQTAMSDACLHNVEIARAALAKVEASDA